MSASGMRLDQVDVLPAGNDRQRDTGAGTRARRRRDRRPRWGVVNCPDGAHHVDLDVVRRVMTQLLVAGELRYDVKNALATKAGISKSTLSRMLGGRPTGLKTVVAVLGVLQLPTEDVISADPIPDDLAVADVERLQRSG